MQIQIAKGLKGSSGFSCERRPSPLGRLTRFAWLLLSIGAVSGGSALSATPPAPVVTPQQLTVTAANASGDLIYDLNLSTSTSSTVALISGTKTLNTDGTKHGPFGSLVWLSNSFTGTLDLIVADTSKGQILRYAGPSYGTSTVIFTYTTKGSGPSNPTNLAVDAAGDVLVTSPGSPLTAAPGLWVLPFNKTTGVFGTPVLIDQKFGGALTPALADVFVAATAATPHGSAAPAWRAGDVLVLVGDTLISRLMVYSQAAVNGVIANPRTPLTGPTSTAITPQQFLGLIAVPFGMDIWPADATHGVSLLFTTIDGRIVRFDSGQNAFTSNFASGLGLGLQKIKVGTYATKPYAFVAQIGLPAGGQILQFGAPPSSGSNKPVASVSKGVSAPVGLALSSSGSQPASSCVAPNSCSILGPQVSQQISGPGAANIPPGATILEQSCVVPSDPRVAIVGGTSTVPGTWSCLGPTINVCGTTPTPGCVPPTLDVANYCPGFPSTILPASMCGHSGASGAGFTVIKASAQQVDQNANDLYIQTSVDATQVLPGPYDLACQQSFGQSAPLFAWAPRSDLASIEGTIVEDAVTHYFIDLTGFCDISGGNSKIASMFAFGLGLNTAASGLPNGQAGFVNDKFNNLQTTISNDSPQISPATVTMTLQNYVTQSQGFFNSDYQHDVNNYSCALNSIASADIYLRNQAQGTAFSYHPPASGNNNPNPAGDIDARLANLYLTISGNFLATPNMTWPTSNVPPCVTLTISSSSIGAGGSATLNIGPPTLQSVSTPLKFLPSSCTLSASDGTYVHSASVPTSGSVSTGTLTHSGPYSATLDCAGPSGDTAASFATVTATVTAQPTLSSITVTPTSPSVAKGLTKAFTATGHYSNGTTQNLTSSVTWISSVPTTASITNPGGVATCLAVGNVSISANLAGVVGATPLQCTAPTVQSISVTPANSSLAKGSMRTFTATANYSDGSAAPATSVTWNSNTPAVATINYSSGVATCVAGSGSTTISANSGGLSGSTSLTCTAAALQSIAVTPANPSIAKGLTQQFTATGTDTDGTTPPLSGVSWTSTNQAVATINSTSGIATCVAGTGSTTIFATSGNISGNTTLTCLPPALLSLTLSPNTTQSLTVGGSQQFTVSGAYSDGTTADLTGTATWNSTQTNVATVGNGASGGLVTAVNGGTTQITAASGGQTSPAVTVSVGAPSASITATPSTVMIGQIVTLQWTSSGFSDGSCNITGTGTPLGLNGETASGSVQVSESTPQKVTYTITCSSGPATATAQTTALYTLRTTYQYTGNAFGTAMGEYTTIDRVIASITVDIPVPPNQTQFNPTTLPGYKLALSDGVRTLQLPALFNSFVELSTDGNGVPIHWAAGIAQTTTDDIDTQFGDGFGTLDTAQRGTGVDCDSGSDCGINNSQGSWTVSNVQNLHLFYGTVPSGTAGVVTVASVGRVYGITVSGPPSSLSLSAISMIAETPQPTSCSSSDGLLTPDTVPAVTTLAFAPNATTTYSDLIAGSLSGAAVFTLAGPSYQPNADLNNASDNCWDTGPAPTAVAADSSGSVLGVGHDVHNAGKPSVYYFPPAQAGVAANAPNFVLIDNVNSDPSLTSCLPSAPSGVGCVASLVDAVVAPNAISGASVGAGDLLVLVGDQGTPNAKPVVLRVPASAIQSAKGYAANCPSSYGDSSGTPPPCVGPNGSSGSVLVNQLSMGLSAGESPLSMDISPLDGSLFIATNNARIIQLTPGPTGYGNPQIYAHDQFGGLQKIRVAQQNGILYLSATLANDSSQVVVYAGPPPAGGFGATGAGVAYADVTGFASGLAFH